MFRVFPIPFSVHVPVFFLSSAIPVLKLPFSSCMLILCSFHSLSFFVQLSLLALDLSFSLCMNVQVSLEFPFFVCPLFYSWSCRCLSILPILYIMILSFPFIFLECSWHRFQKKNNCKVSIMVLHSEWTGILCWMVSIPFGGNLWRKNALLDIPKGHSRFNPKK